jgi:hypothetical protein
MRKRNLRFSLMNLGIVFLWLIIALSIDFSVCQSEDSTLTNTFASPKKLAKRFLSALKNKDEKALWALIVTESEYKNIIWPPYEKTGLGSPEQPFYFNRLEADKTIRRVLNDLGGKKLKFVKVYFAKGKDKEVGPFVIWRDFRIVVKNEKGEELELNHINTVVEIKGQYKIVAYHS